MANAVGTVLGCLALIILMEERGIDFIKESFPATFTSKWWSWTEGMTLDIANNCMIMYHHVPTSIYEYLSLHTKETHI